MLKWKDRGSSKALPVIFAVTIWLGGMGNCAHAQHSGSGEKDAFPAERRLSLKQVIDLALITNRTIRGSAFGVKSQEYGVVSAESEFEWTYRPATTATATPDANRVGVGLALEKKSRYGPTLRVTPEVVHDDGRSSEDAVDGQVDVNLSIPLLRGWGREANLSSVEAARYASRSIRRSHHLTKVNVVLDAVSAVYAIVEQEELLKLNRLETKSFETHAVMAAAKEKIGLASPMDVYRAQIRLKDAQDRLNRTLETLRNANDRLKLILSVPLEETLAVSAPMTYQPVEISVEAAVESAFQHRLEVVQSADEIENLGRASRVAQHYLKPQLDLVGHYNRLGLDPRLEEGPDPNEEYWSVSLVSTTDWRRTSEKVGYRQSLLALKAAKLKRWTLTDDIRRQVRQNYDSLLRVQERMKIRDEQIQQARGKLALAQVKFNHGMADNFNVIEAQTELQTAQASHIAAKLEHILGRYRLRAAMGTLLEHKEDDDPNLTP